MSGCHWSGIFGSIFTYGDHGSHMRATNVGTSCAGLIYQTGRAYDRPRKCGTTDEVLVGLVFPMEIVTER
jgi:hypothetical protein